MENQRVKPSAYNIIIEKPDGLAIYNTVTGKMIRCFNDADVVRNILNAEMVNNYPLRMDLLSCSVSMLVMLIDQIVVRGNSII